MRFAIIITALFIALAYAIPIEESAQSADVALTPNMQNTIELANAVLQQAGVNEAERTCGVTFRKCYTGCTGAPTCYAVCFLKFCK